MRPRSDQSHGQGVPRRTSCIVHLLASDAPYGTYDVSGSGEPATWADIARAVRVSASRGMSIREAFSVPGRPRREPPARWRGRLYSGPKPSLG